MFNGGMSAYAVCQNVSEFVIICLQVVGEYAVIPVFIETPCSSVRACVCTRIQRLAPLQQYRQSLKTARLPVLKR